MTRQIPLWLTLGAAALAAGCGEEPTNREGAGRIRLPIEVMGAGGYTVQVPFDWQEAESPQSLWLQAHRLAFEDASTNPERGAKGSVRLDDGEWLALTNETVTCAPHEAAYGCLNGAYHTVRLTVPMDQLGTLAPGEHAVEFRFEGTDGQSMGYRILALNFLDDADNELLGADGFVEDSPDEWGPPLPSSSDIARGKELYSARTLVESPLSTSSLQAACSDCHAHDGRDLAYFNYSNWSIIARSQFHGMTYKEGQQIASYIRSLDLDLPEGVTMEGLGRPWSPPYQPGVDLDELPVERWSAGAGLAAVLETDSDMLPHLFPEGAEAAAIAAALAPTSNVPHRTLPVAIQYPDWNEWLPEVHPLDVFGPEFEYAGYEVGPTAPFDAYRNAREEFSKERKGATTLEDATKQFSFFTQRTHEAMGGAILGDDFQELDEQGGVIMTVDGPELVVQSSAGELRTHREVANRSIRHWSSVKQWEIMQEFGLEERNQERHGPEADTRAWLTGARNVFELAPHRTAYKSKNQLAHQSLLVGKYFSTAWYQLQVSINSGQSFSTGRLHPVDWNYQPNHIDNLFTQADGPKHPLRYAATFAELYQVFEHRSPTDASWGFRQMHPVRYVPRNPEDNMFSDLVPALSAKVLSGLLSSLMDLLERHEPSDWSRSIDPENHQVEPADYVPATVLGSLGSAHHEGRYADCWFTMIPLFRDVGVDEATLTRVIDWGAEMWPLGDWDSLRS